MSLSGPEPQDHTARLHWLRQFLEQINARYPGKVLLAALYGSLARNEDGPYSDIELFCVIDQPGLDKDLEWVYGCGKAEINLMGLDVARRAAGEVDEYWALSAGQFGAARLLQGDAALLEELRSLALHPPVDQVHETIHAILVEELYEWMGKLRNSQASGELRGTPLLVCRFIEMTALMLGLAHRQTYTTGMSMLPESLSLPDFPDGYAALCNRVLTGELDDPAALAAGLEQLWSGLGEWLHRHGLPTLSPSAWPD